jgi:hypothetical protein
MSVVLKTMGLAFLLMCSAHRQQGRGEFRVPLPASVATRPTYLVLRDVTAPANRPLILRAYAAAGDSSIQIGSTAMLGVSPSAAGDRTVPVLRMDVTAGVRRLAESGQAPDTLAVRIVPTDARGRALADVRWSVRQVELVQPE